MKPVLGILLFAVGATAKFATGPKSQDIVVKIENSDYELEAISVDRWVNNDHPIPFLCKTPHWLLEFYWAGKEWTTNLNHQVSGEHEFTATVRRSFLQNDLCGTPLIMKLNIWISDNQREQKFPYERNLSVDGDETVLLGANCTYTEDPSLLYPYSCQDDPEQRLAVEGKNVISVTIR